MDAIFRDNISMFDGLATDYVSVMSGIKGKADALRERLLRQGKIVPLPQFSADELGRTSLCAIDGASGISKLQSADILITGSSFHDGLNSKQSGVDPDSMSVSFADIRLHSNKNDQILGAMRAFTEIEVLGSVPHDVVIIDGAYLGNFLTVLYALWESKAMAERVIERLQKDSTAFIKGVNLILDTKEQIATGRFVAGLSKSDSSMEMVHRYIPEAKGDSFFANDKMLAEYLLRSGEMLMPVPVRANKWQTDSLSRDPETGAWKGFKWNYRAELTASEVALIDSLFDGSRHHNGQDWFSLYSDLFAFEGFSYFYFKPHHFSNDANALRAEICSDTSDSTTRSQLLVTRAKFIASIIDGDVVDVTALKEPYCQYRVDRIVKQPVSNSLSQYQSMLVQKMSASNLHVRGALDGYRS